MPDIKDEYIVRGAFMKCSKGSSLCQMDLDFGRGEYSQDQPMMNDEDTIVGINISNFGICSITGEACEPAPAKRWSKPHPKTTVSEKPALTGASYLICGKGGVIRFKDFSGQF